MPLAAAIILQVLATIAGIVVLITLIVTVIECAVGRPPLIIRAIGQAFTRCGRGSVKR